MKSIKTASSSVLFGAESYRKLAETLTDKNYSLIIVFVDENTHENCLPYFMGNLEGEFPIEIVEIESGEINKTLETCSGVWEALSELGADRKSAMINLGGGVITDMGGFIASCFKRGIDFYNIPTTLLSMVDASVGGKTGIDLGALKNQIGIIREPQEVVIETGWLQTLPEDELRSGFAEMLKHGLIANPNYWKTLQSLTSLSSSSLEPFIKTSIDEKTKVVLEDPYEKGLRKILNFGHTLGHAIESYYLTHKDKSRLLHGEAIAIGMVMEAYLATHCSGLDAAEADEIKKTFAAFYPQIDITFEDQNEILKLLRHDKKNKAGRINFVLLKAIGSPDIDVEVPHEFFAKAFEFYQSKTN